MDSHLMEQMKRGIEYYKRLKSQFKRNADALRRYGGIALSIKEHNGVKYYTAVRKKNGTERRKYLGKSDNRVVRAVQRRYYLLKAVEAVDENLIALERCVKKMKSVDPAVMVPNFPKAYRTDDLSRYEVQGVQTADGRAWEQRQPKPKFRSKDARYRTSRGEWVRSKTEVIIANELAARSISYVYETVRYINGKRVLPDFVIYYHGKEVIWEHFGMMDDPDYFAENVEKLLPYLNSGYYPNYNFITTLEQDGRELDSLFIGRIIDLWFGNDREPGAAAA